MKLCALTLCCRLEEEEANLAQEKKLREKILGDELREQMLQSRRQREESRQEERNFVPSPLIPERNISKYYTCKFCKKSLPG